MKTFLVTVGYRELPQVTGNVKVDWIARGNDVPRRPGNKPQRGKGRRETQSPTRTGLRGKIIDGKIIRG